MVGDQSMLRGVASRHLYLRSIPGYPGCEFQIRAELANVVGQEKSDLFFDKVRSAVRQIGDAWNLKYVPFVVLVP